MTLRQSLGLFRSVVIYHSNPFYKRGLRRFYSQFIRPGDLCFDIGAHLGSRVGIWRKLGARVVALEPQPRCMAMMERWYGGDPDVELISKAVGATPGELDLYISDRHPTVTSVSPEWIDQVRRDPSFAGVEWGRPIRVPVTTLDALIERFGQPQFCKIDVEGHELAVLEGLSEPVACLSFEYLASVLPAAEGCINRLAELGDYQFNWSVGERQRLRAARWIGAGEMISNLPEIVAEVKSGDIYAMLRR